MVLWLKSCPHRGDMLFWPFVHTITLKGHTETVSSNQSRHCIGNVFCYWLKTRQNTHSYWWKRYQRNWLSHCVKLIPRNQIRQIENGPRANWYHKLSIYRGHIQHHCAHSPAMILAKLRPNFALTNDTPYLALTGELKGVFRELFKEKWLWYTESALYMAKHEPYLYWVYIAYKHILQWGFRVYDRFSFWCFGP